VFTDVPTAAISTTNGRPHAILSRASKPLAVFSQPPIAAGDGPQMSLPREVVPGRFYQLTRRCTQRRFLLRPCKEVNQAYEYCLAVAAAKFGIVVLLTTVMSNHHHTVIYDRLGTYPAFLEYFHGLVARALNAHWDHDENFWSSQQTSAIHLVELNDVLKALAYDATNPITAHLVETIADWPGVSRYAALLSGAVQTIERPKFYFRSTGKMPAQVTIRYEFPAEAGNAEELLQALQERVTMIERALRADRVRRRISVLGVASIRKQHHEARPKTASAKGEIKATFAASNETKRLERLRERLEFLSSYREARVRYKLGKRVVFPRGTYQLRRHHGVRTVGEPPLPRAAKMRTLRAKTASAAVATSRRASSP
jgi:putative transposase